jgi:alpha-galactosidase
VASAGVVCQWDYLGEKFSLEVARASVAEARENQKFWIGDFYPLTSATTSQEQWAAYQFHRPDLDAGIVLVFRRSESSYTGMELKLRGVTPANSYAITFIDDAHAQVSAVLTGERLTAGIEMRLPKTGSSLLVRYGPRRGQHPS